MAVIMGIYIPKANKRATTLKLYLFYDIYLLFLTFKQLYSRTDKKTSVNEQFLPYIVLRGVSTCLLILLLLLFNLNSCYLYNNFHPKSNKIFAFILVVSHTHIRF